MTHQHNQQIRDHNSGDKNACPSVLRFGNDIARVDGLYRRIKNGASARRGHAF